MPKRLPAWVSLVFGVVGVLGCFAAVLGAWSFSTRVNRATANVFDGFEHVLSTAQQQVAKASARVDALKLNAESVSQSLKTWSEQDVTRRLNSRFSVEEKIGRLENGLNQTDQWLGALESSVQVVEQVAESGNAIGIFVKTDALEALQEEVAAVRVSLSEVTGPVTRIREQVTDLGAQDRSRNRTGEIVNLMTRLIATFGSVDARLVSLDASLGEADASLREARKTLSWWTRLAAATISLLAFWMAAGQGAVIYLAVKSLKEPQARSR